MFKFKYLPAVAASIALIGCGGGVSGEKKDIGVSLSEKAIGISALPYSNSPTLINSAIQISTTSLPAPSSIGSKYIDRTYCNSKKDAMVLIAHADDDRYFMGDEIRNELAAGNCLKVLHINAGFDVSTLTGAVEYNPNDPFYYQGRIDGAVATYAKLLSANYTLNIYLTHAWDTVNGQLINRYILSKGINGGNPSGQTIEIQVLGLPNSSNATPLSNAGNVTSLLYSDSNATSINIASKISGYSVNNSYSWENVQGIVNQLFTWLNPYKVYSLDPFGIPNDDGKEGQHPDHIMAARLVYFSDYAKNNPSSVQYFKTYNVNTFEPNLSSSIASATENDLNEHWRFDWGSSFITSTPCDVSNSSASAPQFKPDSWACKKYTATSSEYFVARNVVDSNNLCLNATGVASLNFGTCGASSLQVTIGKSNLAWVSNNSTVVAGASSKYVLYPNSLSNKSKVELINFTSPQSSSAWHYNDLTNKFEFTYLDGSNNKVKSCLSKDSNGNAILDSCASAITLKPSDTQTQAVGSLHLKNAKTGTCLGISSSGVALVSCTDPKASLSLNSGKNLTSSDGSYCLNSPTFAAGGALTAKTCSTSLPGQKFTIEKITTSGRVVVRPNLDHMCVEDDLNIWACHAYEQQNWIVN
ncbi:PIG-L family deacetylase [Undibacterium crateris]|uniref:PIG-L family deacetylase n=1 Tax=Undibacterium crateris TaxID=2528175 RepID=UPI00138A5516|nr:PIG-L family deacetylase [Undibacterium crateris]NDI87646.1 hypothetical protein [Undibacterium crateris]